MYLQKIFELTARKFFLRNGLLRSCSVFCCALLCVHSGFAIILMGRDALVALVSLSSCVSWLFLKIFLAVLLSGY